MQAKRTFRAGSMSAAVELVKHELGADAVILSSRKLPPAGPEQRSAVEITATPPPQRPASRLAGRPSEVIPRGAATDQSATPSPAHVETIAASGPADADSTSLQAMYTRLVQNDVADEIAAGLLRQAGSADPASLQEAVRSLIARMIPTARGSEAPPVGGLRRIALLGPAGAGKTTTLAKLAAQFKFRERRRVALLSLDMHRLGAAEQLGRFARIIGVPLLTAQTVVEVKEVCAGLEADVLLIDTPGVGQREAGRFARLAAVLRAARPHESHLVLPASLAPAVQASVAANFAALGVSHVILTRLDEAVGFGVILSVMQKLDWALSYVSHGQRVPNDIEIACGPRLAELILPG